jgi:hypothetical protein
MAKISIQTVESEVQNSHVKFLSRCITLWKWILPYDNISLYCERHHEVKYISWHVRILGFLKNWSHWKWKRNCSCFPTWWCPYGFIHHVSLHSLCHSQIVRSVLIHWTRAHDEESRLHGTRRNDEESTERGTRWRLHGCISGLPAGFSCLVGRSRSYFDCDSLESTAENVSCTLSWWSKQPRLYTLPVRWEWLHAPCWLTRWQVLVAPKRAVASLWSVSGRSVVLRVSGVWFFELRPCKGPFRTVAPRRAVAVRLDRMKMSPKNHLVGVFTQHTPAEIFRWLRERGRVRGGRSV